MKQKSFKTSEDQTYHYKQWMKCIKYTPIANKDRVQYKKQNNKIKLILKIEVIQVSIDTAIKLEVINQ